MPVVVVREGIATTAPATSDVSIRTSPRTTDKTRRAAGGLVVRNLLQELNQKSDCLLVPPRLRRKTPEGEHLGNEFLQPPYVLVAVSKRRGVSFRFPVAFRRNRDYGCPRRPGLVHRALAGRRDHEVRGEHVVVEVR